MIQDTTGQSKNTVKPEEITCQTIYNGQPYMTQFKINRLLFFQSSVYLHIFFVQRRVQTVLPVNFELHRCGHDQIRPLNMLLKLVSLCSHDTDDLNQHQTATMFISTCRRPSLLSLNPLNIYPNTNTDVQWEGMLFWSRFILLIFFLLVLLI